MSTPNDPFESTGPGSTPPPPPGYGQPQPPAAPYGYAQPGYGVPGTGPAGYGASAPGMSPYGELASWPLRVASYLIDGLVVAVPLWILFFIGAAIGHSIGVFVMVIGYLVGLAIWIWNLLRQGTTGKTVGKQVIGTTLVREQDGQFVGGGMSIVRAFAHIVDGLACDIGYLWPLWDAKRQTFADKIMSTLVVKR